MKYKTKINGKEIEYGALVENHIFQTKNGLPSMQKLQNKITQKFLKKENRILHLLTRLVL